MKTILKCIFKMLWEINAAFYPSIVLSASFSSSHIHQSSPLSIPLWLYITLFIAVVLYRLPDQTAVPLKVTCGVNFKSIKAAVRNDERSTKLYLRLSV